MHPRQTPGYRIVVEGAIDPIWHESLHGLVITEERHSGQAVVTQLEGSLADQAALHGVINTLFMLRVHLVFVARLPAEAIDEEAIDEEASP